MRSHAILWGSLLIALSWPVCGLAAVTRLTVAADTFIDSGSPGNNAGGHAWFDAGTDGKTGIRRGLLRFDLSSIPPDATITSAEVQLTVVKVPASGPVNSTFDLSRLLASWNEGTRVGNAGAPAATGETTWNARMLGTANWTAPGARSDAATTPSASTTVGTGSNAKYTWSGPGLVNDVQLWVDDPSQNFGWLLTSQAESSLRSVRGFASREGGVNAGTLVVNYTVSNAAPSVAITSPASGESFVSPASVTIDAEASDSDGAVAKVEFFDDANSLGSVKTSPYTMTVTLYPGTHSLTAVATDDMGAVATSSVVTLMVTTVPIEDPIPPHILKGDIVIELQSIVDGLTAPLSLAVPDDGSGRMFVYDQAGLAWVVIEGIGKLPTPLLDVTGRLVTQGNYDERGLLGLATHPDFAENPFVYTYTSEPVDGPADFVNVMPEGTSNDHQSVIARWTIDPNDPNRVDPATRREILRIDEPQANHNGGTLRFGPDGFLYVSLGDGGRANDVAPGHVPGGNAQSLQRIYGKLLRIDVDGTDSANGQYGIPPDNPFVGQDAVQEVYAYGLRNPYTYSFDRLTGDLYLGDAGQNNIEEVDLITKGGNYGWNVKEGSFWFDSVSPNLGSVVTGPVRPVPPDLIDPIAEYDHDEGSVVIGGYVYRGSQIPALQGTYIFGDWGSFAAPSARLFYLDPNLTITEMRLGLADRPTDFWLRGFGEGPDGELYVFGSRVLGPHGDTGEMFKIVSSLPVTYAEHDLVSDIPGRADWTDPNLVDPWGLAFGPTTPFWIADRGTGVTTIYDGNGVQPRTAVTIPAPAGVSSPSQPMGIVFNATTEFTIDVNVPARYIFATTGGTLAGWNSGADAVLLVDRSTSGASYTGLALGVNDSNNYLYVANFGLSRLDVFDASFTPVDVAGSFSDPNLPVGFAPFNVQNIAGELYVTYTNQDGSSAAGGGLVNVFDPNGQFLRRLASGGPLDTPWGMALAPADFGGFSGALLVGNVGDGTINAFNRATGEWLGALEDESGTVISIPGLRGLTFGNGELGGDSQVLYFAAGIAGNGEVGDHGLFGSLAPTGP